MRWPVLIGGAILISACGHSAVASQFTVSGYVGGCDVFEGNASGISFSCPTYNGGLASAASGGGHLSVLAAASADRTDGVLTSSGATQAIAFMSDTITFGVDTGVFVVPLDFSGEIQTVVSLGSLGSSVQNLSASISGGFSADNVNLTNFYYYTTESVDQNTDTITETGQKSAVQLAAISFTGGQTTISASIRADAACGSVGQDSSCAVVVDYSNSLRFLAGLLYDLDGNPLPDVSVTSSSGFDYLTGVEPNISAAPLPAGLPLFASGLGLFGLLGWRRNRRPTLAA